MKKSFQAFMGILLIFSMQLFWIGTADEGVFAYPTAYAAEGTQASSDGSTLNLEQPYVSDKVVVVYKDGVTASEASQTLAGTDTVEKEDLSQSALDDNNHVVTATVSDTSSVPEAVSALSQDPNVAIVQPDYTYSLLDDSQPSSLGVQSETNESSSQGMTINDPDALTQQWQLGNVACYDAWDCITCSHNVSVAVIDTGIDASHPDLKNNIVGAYDAVNKVLSPTMQDTSSISHGTHVAGIISAETNNGIGGSGVSYNANIVPIMAFSTSKNSFTDDTLLSSFTYIMSNAQKYNIRVINLSLGGYGSIDSDPVLKSAIDNAEAAGILTVCAAGNSPTTDKDGNRIYAPYNEYPGDYKECVSVINTDSANALSSTSNYNSEGTATNPSDAKNISAPGTNIYSTVQGGGYGRLTGTSMAAPVVSGIAALVFAANESLTPLQARNILYSTATDLGDTGWDRQYGYGEVNALKAVQAAGSGWRNIEGSEYYYENCSPVKGSRFIDGKWYRFDLQSGRMLTGSQCIDGNWYRYDLSAGYMLFGSQCIDGKWYYYDPNAGYMHFGSTCIDGNWYRYDLSAGYMLFGSQCIDGKWYYYDPNAGYMHFGSTCIDGNWYWYDLSQGYMCFGWLNIYGTWHYYDSVCGRLIS